MQRQADTPVHGLTGPATGLLWIAGGSIWLVAGFAFDTVEAMWILADLLLLAGLIGLRGLRADGGSRLGTTGTTIAIVGRLVFIGAEVLSIVQHTDENALLPLGAVLTALGMLLYAVAVFRAHHWPGPARFGPLVMGLYPFVVMFPLLAASGGNPPAGAIAGWGAAAIIVGAAALAAPPAVRPPAPKANADRLTGTVVTAVAGRPSSPRADGRTSPSESARS